MWHLVSSFILALKMLLEEIDQTDWKFPFWLLMIIGGDIVHQAIAKSIVAGEFPIIFSFGWYEYIAKTIISDNPLPKSGLDSQLINTKSGYGRKNKSWVLDRLLSDWIKTNPTKHALEVSVFKFSNAPTKRNVIRHIANTITTLLQIGICAVPLYESDSIVKPQTTARLFILASTLLLVGIHSISFLYTFRQGLSGMPRLQSEKTVVLTTGNGSQHAIVIVSEGNVYDLENLASKQPCCSRPYHLINLAILVAWLIFYLAVPHVDAYLFVAAAIGFLHNIAIAGSVSGTRFYGLNLQHVTNIKPNEDNDNVLAVLQKLEDYDNNDVGLGRSDTSPSPLAGAGLSLVPVFFPGKLRPEEELWVEERKKTNADIEVRHKLAKKVELSRRKA